MHKCGVADWSVLFMMILVCAACSWYQITRV